MLPASYPWENLLVHFENLRRQRGLSAEQAAMRIAGDVAAGRSEIRPLVAVEASGPVRLRLGARDSLKVVIDGFPFDADRFEIRRCPIPATPGLLGPSVPMDDATRKLFEARLRELGGAHVISSSGTGFMLPTVDEPPSVQPQSAPNPVPEPDPPPAPLSIDEQGIALLVKTLKQHQAEGTTKPRAFYRKLLKQELGIGVGKFDYIVWPAAFAEPNVKPAKVGAPKKKK